MEAKFGFSEWYVLSSRNNYAEINKDFRVVIKEA
jgi:hypothetical protein